MSNALDMSLDDLIKNKKKRSRETGGSSAPRRRPSKRPAISRSTPFSANKPVSRSSESRHERDRNEAAAAASNRTVSSAIETGTKLYISNLDYGVTNDDIKELFSEVGDLKRSTIHYDKSGRSKGSAEVVFARREDALAAIKRYNNVQLDGKPIKIEYIGANLSVPAVNTQSTNGMPENTNKSSGRGHGRSGRRRRRGRGHQRKKQPEEKSVQDLDAELENYHAQAMQTE